MKLTKGKISKAMHKKNQTLKRYKKNSKKYIKSKTFRRRGAVSLDKMTLKNVKSLIGGANTPPDKDSPLESEKPADVIGKNESNVAPLVSDETKEEETKETKDVIGNNEANVAPLVSEETKDLNGNNEVNVNPLVSEQPELLRLPPTEFPRSPAPSATARSKQPKELMDNNEAILAAEQSKELMDNNEAIVASGTPSSTDSIRSPSPLATDRLKQSKELMDNNEVIVSPPPVEVQAEAVTDEAQLPVLESTPLTQTKPEDNKSLSIVAESLEKLAEYISDKISKKIKDQLNGSSRDLNDDSFDAVNNATSNIVVAPSTPTPTPSAPEVQVVPEVQGVNNTLNQDQEEKQDIEK